MSNVLINGRPAEVLLAEDNDNDVELTRISFEQARLAINLHRVANGEECMAYLRKEGIYANVITPDLLLLDLHMPRMDGFEVLKEIECDESLKHLPVVVLTSSEADKDVLMAYKLHCNSYLAKPIGFEKFSQIIQSLAGYWFTLVILPTNND